MILYELKLYLCACTEKKEKKGLAMAKWFKNLAMICCVMIVAVFSLAGCGNSLGAFKENPAASEIVYGNGSLAVTKGDYLYFVNGYVGYSSVGDTNYDGQITYPALYRIKMDNNGHPVEVEPELDDEGEPIFDGSQSLENVELMVGKVVGFEYMGIYIFDNWLYYTSPHNGKDKNLTPLTEHVDFFRIKLDRSGASEILYTSKEAGTAVKYTMMQIGGTTQMIILDGEKLLIRNCTSGSSKVIAEDVTGVALPKYSSSDTEISAFNKDIYYTRALDEEQDGLEFTSGNVLCKVNLETLEKSIVEQDNSSTFTLKTVSALSLFYEKTTTNPVDSAKLYAYQGGETFSDYQVTANAYSGYIATDATAGGGRAVIANNGSRLILLNFGGNEPTAVYEGSATIICVSENYVYFFADSKVKRIDYQAEGATAETLTPTGATIKSGQTNAVAIYGNKVFYFKSYTSGNYYLHMTDLGISFKDPETGAYYDHFVGVLEESDYLTE